MAIETSIGLEQAMQKLDMDESKSAGLKWVRNRKKENNPYVYLILEQAETFGATAVYFRFFSDGRPPRAQVFVYSFDELREAKIKGPEIHHRLWNAGIVPYCFIYGVTQILVYNCNNSPKTDGQEFVTQPNDFIDLLGNIQEALFARYSARQFDSGLFWDSENAKTIKYEQSAYEQLLTQLKNVKNFIIAQAGKDNTALTKRVLMMLILIKYLEERKDENNHAALIPNDFYAEFTASNPSLVEVLKNTDILLAVLNKLSSSEHFNGQIFQLSREEQAQLKKIDPKLLVLFQHFVDGYTYFFSPNKSSIGQMSMWRLYSFSYLPIELISHIYEDFLTDENGQKKKGVVYTPPYLVQFLVDRCMPLDQPKENFKILDPACGSGIFLVGAFKRIIQWWRVMNNWALPNKENIEKLKALLLANIYGCDIEDEAVRLSYFSLSLALLDALSPIEIWKNVHFDNLMGKNLFSGDFFQILQQGILHNDFDLVIGNPPFKSEFTDAAQQVDVLEKSLHINRPNIPDNQIALLFLEQSIKLLNKNGKSCLILSSGPLLYNTNAHEFKRYLFENFHFEEIYDFTPLRAKLFRSSSASAKPAALAVLAKNNLPKNNPVYHFLFRRTKAAGEKIEFEIDHYDIHAVSYKTALDNPRAWQANFMGGARLFRLLEKLKNSPTLEEYLKTKKKKNGWVYGEGWQECSDSPPLKKIKVLLSRRRTVQEDSDLAALESKHKADWITNKLLFEPDGSIEICQKIFFQWPRKKELFQPPLLLIHESVKNGEIPSWLIDEYTTFKDSIFGIHAPIKDKKALGELQKYIGNKHNVALIWLISGKVITMREGVPLMGDVLSLPYPRIEFNEIEKILLEDIVDYYAEFRKEGEKSEVLEVPTPKDLVAFGELYSCVLNSVYKHFSPANPIVGKDFICYPFILGNASEIEIPNSIEGIENKLKSLINNRVSSALWIKRIVKVYDKNVIFLYKPNQKRYWLRSIAIRDADETFMDLFKQGK